VVAWAAAAHLHHNFIEALKSRNLDGSSLLKLNVETVCKDLSIPGIDMATIAAAHERLKAASGASYLSDWLRTNLTPTALLVC